MFSQNFASEIRIISGLEVHRKQLKLKKITEEFARKQSD